MCSISYEKDKAFAWLEETSTRSTCQDSSDETD
jgi:hypothetical protein